MSATKGQIDKLITLAKVQEELVQYVNNLIPSIKQIGSVMESEIAIGKKELVEALQMLGIDCSMIDSLSTLASKMGELTTLYSVTYDCTFSDTVSRPIGICGLLCNNGAGITSINNRDVTSVGSNAFYGRTSLQEVNLPNVTSVGSDAFRDCTSLQEVNLPNVIGANAQNVFRGCSGLRKVYIPNKSTLGSYYFYGCRNLYQLDISNATSRNSNQQFTTAERLIDIIVGSKFNSNINLFDSSSYYNPTVAYNKQSNSLCFEEDIEEYGQTFATNFDKWKWCIINHFAANLPDRTGSGAYTISINSPALAQFDEEMIAAFTSKNWNLA